MGTDRAGGLQPSTHELTCSLSVLQEQAAKAADVAAEVEQEAASLREASTSAQEDSLAAAAALARLGEDLRKSEVNCDAPLQHACDMFLQQRMTGHVLLSAAPLTTLTWLQGARLDTQRALAEERVAKEMVQERCASIQQVRCALQGLLASRSRR